MTAGDLAWMSVIALPAVIIALGILLALASAFRRRRTRRPVTVLAGEIQDRYGSLLQGRAASQTAIELACEDSLRRSRVRRAAWGGD